MMIHTKTSLLVSLCFIALCTRVHATFGYVTVQENNLGDAIQSLAAKRFLPNDAFPIDRETIPLFKSGLPTFWFEDMVQNTFSEMH